MKDLKIGVIGVGDRGYFVEGFHRPDLNARVVGIAETNQKNIDRFKAHTNIDAYVTNDYQDLLQDDEINAIVIMTEDYKHKEHVIDVLNAGKDVYLEKPMAITIEDCDQIIDVWKKSGRKLMIGFNMRYMPMYETMKAIIDEGHIGDVKAIWIRHFVGRGGVFYYQDWHRNAKYTNSLLLQKGTHDIDVIHMLTDSYIKKVSAFGSLDFYDDPDNFDKDGLEHQTDSEMDVEDNNVLILELENGVKAAYLQNHFTPDYQRNYVVIGTKGRLENDEINETISLKTRHTESLSDKSDVVYQMKETTGVHAGGDQAISRAFIDYVLHDVEPKATPYDGRMSVAVGVKATESLRNGGGLEYVPFISEE